MGGEGTEGKGGEKKHREGCCEQSEMMCMLHLLFSH